MSLENAILENTTAIRDLIAAMSKAAPSAHAQVAATVEAPTIEAPTIEAPTIEAPTIEAPTAEAPTAEAPTVDFEAVKKPFLMLVNTKGRDAAVALLTAFGVKAGGKLGDIPAEKFPEVLDAIKKEML